MDIGLIIKITLYAILIGVPLIVLNFYLKSKKVKQREEWLNNKRYITLCLLVPKENEKGPLAAEQMFAAIHGIYKEEQKWQDQISFELISRNKFVQFYIHLPDYLKDFIEGQIYAQYPNVEIYETTDYSYEEYFGKKIVGTELSLTKPDSYPIKTFTNFEVDPLAAITGVLSQCNQDEQIWIQFVMRPAPDSWQNKGLGHVNAVRSGKTTGGGGFILTVFKFIFGLLGEIIKSIAGRNEEAEKPKEIKLSAPKEAALKGIETKVTKLGFGTKIRIVSLASSEGAARSKIESICGAYKQYNTTNLNGFSIGKLAFGREFLAKYQKREFEGDENILNIEELASLYHLPTVNVETPNIVWAGSKKGEPPSNLPIEGEIEPEEITLFAKTDFRHFEHSFGLKKKDRRLHMYAIGKTGTGKSTMLENMIIDDIRKGRGLAVVDPHGDLVSHALDFVPANRINDVVYFNPADKEYAIGFNPLESVNPDLKNIVASGVVGIFKKIFGESWGPRLEYILRNAILALLDYPNSTLLGIMRLLTDKDFRKKVVEKIQDPVIKDFFVNEYEKYDPKFRTEAVAPIQNKVGQFLSSSTIRNIVGQPKSTLDIEKIMNEGKILLVDLSTGKIGEDNSALLGSMLITKVQLAAMQRATMAESERRDFYLYVDEFQNFATESFAVILSEARKYRLNLVLTNQYIAQMPEVVAKAVFGNVGTMVSFRVGAQDASFLVREFEPVFTANDMVNLDNYHIYIKMAIDGVTRPAFSAATLPPAEGKEDNREKIITASRERYGQRTEIIEEKIQQWSEELAQAKEKQAIEDMAKKKKGKNFFSSGQETEQNDNDYRVYVDDKKQNWYLYTSKKFANKEKNIELEHKNEPEISTVNEVNKEVQQVDRQLAKSFFAKSVEKSLENKKIEPVNMEKNKDATHLEAGESIKFD